MNGIINILVTNDIFIFKIIIIINYLSNMACGCKKNAAAKSSTVATATPKAASTVQESKPQKKVGNRIIKREIR